MTRVATDPTVVAYDDETGRLTVEAAAADDADEPLASGTVGVRLADAAGAESASAALDVDVSLSAVDAGLDDRDHGAVDVTVAVENRSTEPIRLQAIDVLDGATPFGPTDRAFVHGYQSWTPTATLRLDESFPEEKPADRPQMVDLAAPRDATTSHAVTALSGDPGRLALGFLEHDAYLTRFDLRTDSERDGTSLTAVCPLDGVELAPGDRRESATLRIDAGRPVSDALADLADAVGDRMDARVPESAPTGWCSWYHYFTDVTAADVRENAADAAWAELTRPDLLTASLYERVDAATSTRKDDAAVKGLADRIAPKLARDDDHRDRFTRDELSDIVAKSADDTEEYDDVTFGETARENVLDRLWSIARTVPDDVPNVSTIADDRDAASDLIEGMRETDIISPPTDCLAPITAELIEQGLRKEYDADFYAASTRDASVHGGDPFIVEAGIAYGGDVESEGKAEVMRFANRVPLVYQRGACATTDVVKSINWRNYNLDQPGGSGIPNGPAVIMVHVASTNVPFTSESKDAVANVPELESEIELAIREAARELKSFLKKRRSMQQRREKQDKLATILPEMATKLSEVTGRQQLNIDDSLARIMNNVLIERQRDGDTVRLVVENNSDRAADVEITDIVAGGEPVLANGDASVVEMDGEWFVKWSASVSSGDEAVLEYDVSADAEFEISVDGIEEERITVDA